jgi:hypothetical protein
MIIRNKAKTDISGIKVGQTVWFWGDDCGKLISGKVTSRTNDSFVAEISPTQEAVLTNDDLFFVTPEGAFASKNERTQTQIDEETIKPITDALKGLMDAFVKITEEYSNESK